MLRGKRTSKVRTRSTTDPYTTEELTEIIEQINMGFGTIKQFMVEISAFVDFEATEFVDELNDTITAIEKHY